MNKTMLLAATAVLGLTAGGAIAASHPGVVAKTTHVAPIQSPGKTLYSQNSNFLSQSLVSDNFTSGTFGSYSDAGADDFVVPAGKKWKVTGVDVTGLYSNCTAGVNCGPATSEVITFYKDAKGVPGAVVNSQTVNCTDSSGSFACKISAVSLKGGTKGKTYWVSVAANMNFQTAREWYWTLTSIHGNQAEWENPGGGFAVCPTWGTNGACLGYSGDYAFDLKGKGG